MATWIIDLRVISEPTPQFAGISRELLRENIFILIRIKK